jgi:NADPH:quinone reductase-like Zn-dependent oxidoreductase
MRAIYVNEYGELEVLEREDPLPAKGQVRVRVKACGLNFSDFMARLGLYPDAPPMPCVLGYEVAGEIDALGEAVSDFNIGDRVMAITPFGGHADLVCVLADKTALLPADLDFNHAAAIPVNYLTAYHALFHVGNVKPSQSILIHMAAGGVGIAALQLCMTVPNLTTYGTASSAKHDAIRKHGCDYPIDYRSHDYADEVMRLSQQKGVDLILDALGGNDWKKGYDLLAPMGKLVVFGSANMASGNEYDQARVIDEFMSTNFNPAALMNHNRSLCGVHMGRLWNQTHNIKTDLNTLVKLYQEGRISPQVDSVYGFDNAADAYARMQKRQNIGKIVLTP